MISGQRARLIVVTGFVMLAGACAAADESAGPERAEAATTSVAASASSQPLPPTTAVIEPSIRPSSTSPIANKIMDLGAAIYEPADHSSATPAPLRLAIDDIGIEDAPVEDVGVLPDGRFEVPDARVVGWYRFGPSPLEDGTSVLAAHLNYDGVDGVFRRLADVAVGAEVIVTLTDGTALSYRVTEIRLIDKNSLPPEEIWNRDGPPRLALITCGGRYDPVGPRVRRQCGGLCRPGVTCEPTGGSWLMPLW